MNGEMILNSMSASESLITLESPRLLVRIDAANGGKVRSLQSRRTGKEFFYQDSRRTFDGAAGYSYHDIGGMDECFPSIGACRGRTASGVEYDYPDHGFLWQGEWEVEPVASGVRMRRFISALHCMFERTCTFDRDDRLRFEYRVVNHGDGPIPFLYAVHPLLAADEQTRVQLPHGASQAYVGGAGPGTGLTAGEWFTLPGPQPSDVIGPFSLERRTVLKFYTERLADGRAAVEYHDCGERLTFDFDVPSLPHLGFLSCQGNDNLGDGHFTREFLLALEPTSGIGDDIETCERTGTLRWLEPGVPLSFWIGIGVEPI
jgi:galactose mutarotase-like enzyme